VDPDGLLWSSLGPIGLLSVVIVSLIRGWLVPSSRVARESQLLADHVKLMADRLADKDAVIAAAHRETDLQREINRQLIAQIHEVCVEGFETVDAYIHALPAAGRRDATAIRSRHSPE
jgi:hypothetical protein